MRIFPPAGAISAFSGLKVRGLIRNPAAREPRRVSKKIEGAVALVLGDIHSGPPVVRIHSQCLTGDVFGSLRCDCRLQLELALRTIARPARESALRTAGRPGHRADGQVARLRVAGPGIGYG